MKRFDARADELIGCDVIIRSLAGIDYTGIVRSIGPDEAEGELFELGRDADPAYQRLVYVARRDHQIRPAAAGARPPECPPTTY